MMVLKFQERRVRQLEVVRELLSAARVAAVAGPAQCLARVQACQASGLHPPHRLPLEGRPSRIRVGAWQAPFA